MGKKDYEEEKAVNRDQPLLVIIRDNIKRFNNIMVR